MARPIRKIIDLAALRHNWKVLDAVSGAAKMLPVVKADAYGHGVDTLLPALAAAEAFAVASSEEALRLRELGARQPIVLLAGLFSPAEIALCRTWGLQPVIHNACQLQWLCEHPQERLSAWLKIDCGMHRLGFRGGDEAREAIACALRLPQVRWLGALSHFSCAEAADPGQARAQLAVLDTLELPMGWRRCYANSAALFSLPAAQGDWVRPGVMLYGMSPFAAGTAADFGLRPVMRLLSEVIAVRRLKKGETAGYGRSFAAPSDGWLAVVAGGYGDGLARSIPGGQVPVLIGGRRYPLVGRVTMDMAFVWLGENRIAPGEKLTFFGPELPAEEVARAAGTIPYTLTTMLTARVPAEVVDG